ncbi:Checkpoint kinase 2, partial [Perkinsus olseni]
SFIITHYMFTSPARDSCSATQLATATQDWQPPPPLTGDSEFETPVLIGTLYLTINTSQWKNKEQTLELWSDRSSWRIGRDGTNDVEVQDPKVSTVHVRLDHDPSKSGQEDEITITDVSRNGTYIGSRRLIANKTEVLRPGESFSLVTSPFIRGHPEPLLVALWKPLGYEDPLEEEIMDGAVVGMTQAMPPAATQVREEVPAPRRRRDRDTVGQQDPVIAQLSGDIKYQWRPSTSRVTAGLRSSITIGRSPSCSIVLNDDRVSGSHVTLEHDGKAFHIIDSSTNGTYLNDKRLPKKH